MNNDSYVYMNCNYIFFYKSYTKQSKGGTTMSHKSKKTEKENLSNNSCNCNHEHSHSENSCSCGHEHTHEHSHSEDLIQKSKAEKRIYILENLGCANCAAKMEKKINELTRVESATITYATKQLRVASDYHDIILPELQTICASIESDVLVVPREHTIKKANSKEMHEEHGKDHSLFWILSGAVLFIIGEFVEKQGLSFSTPIFIIAYLILGGEVLMTAIKNLTKGQVFDENFLMSLATLGAFVIKEYPEAVGVMLFYRIGEYFEHRAVEKSRGQIMDAVDLRPEVVNLIDNNEIQVIDAYKAEIGNILLVRPGDRIPLDGIVIDGESRIDTSPITGEPVPVSVTAGSSVTSGCLNTSGVIKIRVEKSLEESMVTRILDSVENAAASKPQIDRFITRFARIYTPFVVILATATAIIPSLITGDWNHWIYTALTFLVISCPCALVLSVPLAFFSGIGAGSKKGILFKGGVSLEAIKNVKAIVMDKTGTITKGNFIVQDIIPSIHIDKNTLLSLCASCESASTHPIGNSIVVAAKEAHLSISNPLKVEELAGKGMKATLEEGEILCGNKKLMESFQIDLSEYKNQNYGTEVLVALNGVFIGHLIIADTIKEDAKNAIHSMNEQGLITVMLTGDALETANAVAKETGIQEVHAKLLPQDKLDQLTNIRNRHGAVMFVGDGINDAPVLAGADVGAAMGSGADAAIEAADVVFMTSNMNAIPQSISIAKATNKIAWQNVIVALLIKAIVMVLGLSGYASMWMAVFADSGVAMLCVLNSIRILYGKNKEFQ